jgi:predicted amidohydrolase
MRRFRLTFGVVALGAALLWQIAGQVAADEPQVAARKPDQVRVAGIVLKWLRTDKEANYRRAEKLIEQAASGKAQLVCTTECFLDGYAIKDKSIPLEEYRALGEPIPDGEFYRRLAALADRLDIHLIAGLLEADGEQRYNTAVLIGPDGKLIGKYRKHKLEHELVRNTPGTETPVFQTPLGTIGIMICADRRDPELVKRLAGGGAELLICPSGGMFGPKSNDPILQDRSKENALPILFVHPAEFLVTDRQGAISARTILGDRLEIEPREKGGDTDQNEVFFFDVPIKPRSEARPATP